MAGVSLRGITKSFGATRVLNGIDLDVADGEFVVFVGPSGCGKSTLLRLVAGLEEPDAGDIEIGGRAVNALSPSERGVAMVFQSYALYPQMTVRQNMAFGLTLARTDKAEIDRRVTAAADILNIGDYLDRKPRALSGGQRQRVAIGRAIVREPQVFLFDEPLSNLDAALRVRMRHEFAALHRRLKTTLIYVTHDQVEAMTLADRIVVLNGGVVEQVGPPMALYDHPATRFVAEFIGSPKMNLIAAEVVEIASDGATVRLANGDRIRTSVDAAAGRIGQSVHLGIRPEHLAVQGTGTPIEIVVTFAETLGSTSHAFGIIAGTEESVTVQLPGQARPAIGAALSLQLPPDRIHLFDDAGLAFPRVGR